MQTKTKNVRYILTLTLVGLAINFSNCAEDNKTDLTPILAILALAGNSGPADLPQPTDGTAIMKLGDESFVLTNQQLCVSGVGGIIVQMVDADNLPILNIHNINFSQTTTHTLGEGGSALDIDTAGGVYGAGTNNVRGTCTATVKETSATIFDLQALNCPITKQFAASNIPDAKLSFRVRCTR
ncbi:hypothetical protein LFX25_05355 [Leptospira sp. FAT2]|uniref:hypothetical protein n=1 Tax=Leptospira sanjuanensis TaxID=2879643 RepID=UPI001EE94A72|nr:hypothetical protein [Leptospira sanjuanensis]MCG6192663.1 hypothetical protein [Leptospira sanjuanensis]